ncbi:MAG TPA: hypothetical protein VLW47_10645 [Thermodesulfobacteriota bacterium]|jgi:hypothetical protein|nr:hypothetical protein [Thermodesulfobacteriota bacterium]
MKSLFKLGVILIGPILFGYAEAWGADWKYLAAGENGICWWYDSQGLTAQPDKMVRVWVKRVKAEEISERVKSGAKIDPSQLEKMISERDYELFLMEIDCVGKTVKGLQKSNYDSKGVLKSGESIIDTKKNIPVDSVAERLYKMVCE